MNTTAFAQQLDDADPLKSFRERFFIPQHNNKDAIYFTGNSLGLQPKTTIDYINQELEDWAALGVMGHTHARNPWLHYHEQFAGPVSRIVGTQENEVVVMNQLTVNIHLLFASFYRPTPERFRIICEAKAFPSDQYALASQAQWHGFDAKDAIIEVAPRAGEFTLRTEDILATIKKWGDSTAVVFFGGVNYYTGQVLDMAAITNAAHEAGVLVGFDLAHAAGNIELQLHNWTVDFACWCSYKYLNSGPGGVSGVYIHENYATNTAMPRLAGWWGTQKERRFLMEKEYEPINTAEGWQLSNAPVLLMAAHKAALDLFEEAGMASLLQKSRLLTDYLFFIIDDINSQYAIKVIEPITPRNAHGCQVSLLMLKKGKEIFNSLISNGVICDWREPNVIRVAPVPLYNSFEDVWTFGDIIKTILDQ